MFIHLDRFLKVKSHVKIYKALNECGGEFINILKSGRYQNTDDFFVTTNQEDNIVIDSKSWIVQKLLGVISQSLKTQHLS